MIGMATDLSFSQNIIARYTGFSDRLSAQAELLYLQNQEGPPGEPVEEIYETNIQNITNINRYFTENPALPLQIDLRFIGKLVSDAVEKAAGARTGHGMTTQRPAVLKTEGKAAASGEAAEPPSEKPRFAREGERPVAPRAAAGIKATEPTAPYMAGDLLHPPMPIAEKTAQRSERAGTPAAEKEQRTPEHLQTEELRMERERLMLKETELEHAASDLGRRETDLREETRALEHEREAARRELAGSHIENKQRFQPGEPREEFSDRIDRPGHGIPETERRAGAEETSSAAPARPAPPEPLDFTYSEENAAGARNPDRVSRERGAKARGDAEGKTPPADTARDARGEAAISVGAESRTDKEGFEPSSAGVAARGDAEEKTPPIHTAHRQAAPAMVPETLVYPEATASGHGETAARREPKQSINESEPGARGARAEADLPDGANPRGSAEDVLPAEGGMTRKQAAPAMTPETLVYPEAAAFGHGETAARREPEPPAYLEAATAGRGEAAVRREPEQGLRGEGAEAEIRSGAKPRGSAEDALPAEGGMARRQAAPTEPADLVLPEKKTPEPQSEEPAAPPKIRFPERAAQESAKRPEPRGTLPHGEPESIRKARRLEREEEPAAPVIVARRAGEEFTPAGIVYGRPAREEPEGPLPERGRAAEPAISGQGGQAVTAEKKTETPRGAKEAFHQLAPFEPIPMEHGAPGEKGSAPPAGRRPAEEQPMGERPPLSTQKTTDSAHGREVIGAAEAESEVIKAGPAAVRKAQAPEPMETILPMASPAMGPERQNPRGSLAAQNPSGEAPGQPPADDFPRRIAAKFHPAAMEQRFRPVSAAWETAGASVSERQGRGMRQAPVPAQNPIFGGRVPPADLEPAFDGEGNPLPASGRMRKPMSSGATDLVLGNHGAPAGGVEGRMAAAGIETRTRQRRKIVSQTEELHERTVNRAVNAQESSGAPRQVSRPAVEEELMSGTNIRKIADKVYQELESRLRSEKIRRGKL